MTLRDELVALGVGVPEWLVVRAAITLGDNGFTTIAQLDCVYVHDLIGIEHWSPGALGMLRRLLKATHTGTARHAQSDRSRTPVPSRPSRECQIEKAIAYVDAFARAPAIRSGPMNAINSLAATLPRGHTFRLGWQELERTRAILQPCSNTLPQVRSGLRCYRSFCIKLLLHERAVLPPQAATLAAWAALFRCEGTFGNYIGYLRTGCMLLGHSVDTFNDPLVKRARRAIKSRGDFVARPKQFLGQRELCMLLAKPAVESRQQSLAMLWLFAYVFLARVPSEALPVARVQYERDARKRHSAIIVHEDRIVLHLARRKNKPRGSTLTRTCWCRTCAAACPVHVLGAWVRERTFGQLLFPFGASEALRELRSALAAVEFARANSYRTHDFRRGHARDLQRAGKTLAEILSAGEWRSCAFMRYLDEHELERDAVVEAHVCESDSETDDD